jgi:ElaB/YqjD/DUF883 family membrane-anchored ribosome-binding protein
MAENILDKAETQVAASMHRLSRASSAMADAIDNSVGVIKHAVKRSGDVAEELMDDAAQRVKRHPVETMAATFGLGLVAGVFIGWMISRK